MATTYANMLFTSTNANVGNLVSKGDPYNFGNSLQNVMNGFDGGLFIGSVVAQQLNGDSAKATGTFTVSGGASGDTATVAGTTLTCVDHRETTNVTFAADSSGSLNSTFFTFQDQPGTHKYYIWFNINSAGVDPAPASRTGIQVSGATNASAATLATAAVAAAASTVGVTVTAGASGHIIVTDNVAGVATAVADGSAPTSFTFTRSITGSALTSAQYNVGFTDTATAANLAAALNANTTTSKYVVATSALGVVTNTATAVGPLGNLVTTTATGNVTASGATLTGGSYDSTTATTFTYHYGY